VLIPQVKCYYVLYKDVRCFQSILKTCIILVNKSRPTETGNPQLHQHTCDTTVHVFVVSFETFFVTWFKYNVHKSLCILIAQLVSFVLSNRFRIQNFFEFKFAYRYLNLYCMASVFVLVLVLDTPVLVLVLWRFTNVTSPPWRVTNVTSPPQPPIIFFYLIRPDSRLCCY